MLGLGSTEELEVSSKGQFCHYDASQLLELDVVGRAVWSLPTNSDLSLSTRLNNDDDRDLLFDGDAGVVRTRARTMPVGNQVPDMRHYQEGVRPPEDYVIKYLREQKKMKLVSLLEQRLSNAAAAKEERPEIEEGQHFLEKSWTFWFDHAPPVTNSSCIWEKKSFEQTVTELGCFNTIEGFWSYWNHLRVGGLKDDCNLRMFQKGTRPTCEEPANRTGGRWVARNLPKETRDKLWSYVVMAVIGEILEEEGNVQSVSGVVLSTREGGDNIQLWLDGGYRYRQTMKDSGKPLSQQVTNTAESSRSIMLKLQRLLLLGDSHEYFTWHPYRVLPNQVHEKPGNQRQQWVAHPQPPYLTQHAPYAQQPFYPAYPQGHYNVQQYPHVPPQPLSPQPQPQQHAPAPKVKKALSPQKPSPQVPPSQPPTSPPPPVLPPTELPQPPSQAPAVEPAAEALPKLAKGNADNEEYRLEKQRQIRDFLTDAEANPGKFTKREVRNSKRQLAMLERRQAQMEAEQAGVPFISTGSDQGDGDADGDVSPALDSSLEASK